ncbi:MAG TPA: exodeoxyribonuclease VII large subunit, partial [Candidatus Limnocylindrales bacterium]|nr:exodeoxyribonuclease VII large subunit [Candidatus Limnocylindrales bacterium]
RIERARESVENLGSKLRRETVHALQLKGMKLGALLDQLESYSPLKVMDRGYSFCQDESGKIIRSVRDLELDRLLQLRFKDGRARCRTEYIEEDSTGV